MRKTKVKAAVEQITTDEFKKLIGALTIMAYYAYDEIVLSKNLKKSIIELGQDAIPIIQKAELPVDAYINAFNEVIEHGSMETTYEEFLLFLKSVAAFQKKLSRISTMSPVLLELLNDARLMANGSDPALARIEQKIGILKMPLLTSIFTKPAKENTQKDLIAPIEKLVQKMGGSGLDLTLDQKKQARVSFPTEYTELLALRREASKKASEFVRNWIRANSDEHGMADYETLLKALKRAKIVIHSYPTGFKGFINDQGQLFTTARKLINGKPGGGVVKMNPNYNAEEDNTYVFKSYIEGALSVTNYYTLDYKKEANQEKFAKVESLAEYIGPMRRQWLAKLRAGGDDEHDPIFLSAMLLEIIYHTQARIGSARGATQVDGVYKQTFGISTIQMRHIRKITGGISINYHGKKFGKQNHKLLESEGPALKKIVKLLSKWKDERKASEPVFMTRRRTPLPGSQVNALIRQIGAPEGVTIHKFRHLKGISMMSEIVSKHPWQKKNAEARSAAQVTQWLKKQAEKIGKQLGHMAGDKVTGTTAIQAYCEPKMMMTLYKDAKVIPPKTMLKLVGIDPNSLEGYEE